MKATLQFKNGHEVDLEVEEQPDGTFKAFYTVQELPLQIDDSKTVWVHIDPKADEYMLVPKDYTDLIEWARQRDKTEEDIFKYFAEVDTMALKDMTDQEIAEHLLERQPIRDQVIDYWMEADTDQRNMYERQMLESWNNPPKGA